MNGGSSQQTTGQTANVQTDPWNAMTQSPMSVTQPGMQQNPAQNSLGSTMGNNGIGGFGSGGGGFSGMNYGGSNYTGSSNPFPSEIGGGSVGGAGFNWGGLVGQMLGAMTPIPGGALMGRMAGTAMTSTGMAPTITNTPSIALAQPVNTMGLNTTDIPLGSQVGQTGQNMGGGWVVGPSSGGGKGSQTAGSNANLINGGSMILPNGDVVGSGAGAGWQNSGSGAYTGASDFAHIPGHWPGSGM